MLPTRAIAALTAVATGSKAANNATTMPAAAMPSGIAPEAVSVMHAMEAINATPVRAMLTLPSLLDRSRLASSTRAEM